MRKVLIAAYLSGLLLPLTDGPTCWLETASVMRIPPETARILAVYDCVDSSSRHYFCWVRWTDYQGKPLGHSRVCERLDGDQLEFPHRPSSTVPTGGSLGGNP